MFFVFIARTIAPKRQKLVQTASLRKVSFYDVIKIDRHFILLWCVSQTIQKAVDQGIEKEVILQAGKNNVGFSLLKSDSESKKKQQSCNKTQTSKSSKY